MIVRSAVEVEKILENFVIVNLKVSCMSSSVSSPPPSCHYSMKASSQFALTSVSYLYVPSHPSRIALLTVHSCWLLLLIIPEFLLCYSVLLSITHIFLCISSLCCSRDAFCFRNTLLSYNDYYQRPQR